MKHKIKHDVSPSIPFSPKEVKKLKICPHCFEEIFEKATVCTHCREHIGWRWIFKPRVSVPVLSSVVSVMLGIITLEQIHEKNTAIRNENIAQNSATQAIGQKNALASDVNKAGLTSTSNLPTANLTNTTEESFKNSVLANATGNIKTVLELAFSLKDQQSIKFVWGGKSPDEGFDSSGFITYILSKVNIIDSSVYRNFSSQKLKESFIKVDPKEIKVGDILIYKTGLALFYLGDNKGIGIGNSNGIKVFDVVLNNNWEIRRWVGHKIVTVIDNQGNQLIDNKGNTIIAIQ